MLRSRIKEIITEEIDKIQQAKEFARDVHSGQWRKGKPVPYMAHPMKIYHRAKKRGLSTAHQILALLHDTYEDAKNPQQTLKMIKKKFGGKITQYVKDISHEKGTNYKEYLLALAKSSQIAFDIKLLDMEDNLSDKPTPRQKKKYGDALQYLLNNGIKIDSKIKDKLFNLAGVVDA